MEIYLIRHTTPQIATGICYGISDISVSDSFADEAQRVLNLLPEKIDAIYSSPSFRCTILAEKINKNLCPDISYKTNILLKELNFGKWEMKQWNCIDKTEFDKWAEDVVNYKMPAGESFFDMNIRVNNFIDELLNNKIKTVLIITHAGVIRCFHARFNNVSLTDTIKIPVEYASVKYFLAL